MIYSVKTIVFSVTFLLCISFHVQSEVKNESWKKQLQKVGIKPTSEAAIQYLSRLTPTPKLEATIASLIKQLGDRRYIKRKEAAGALRTIGFPARVALTNALKQRNLEVARHAQRLLESMADLQDPRHSPATYVVLSYLRAHPSAKAVPVLLSFLATVETPFGHASASEALWHCVKPVNNEAIQNALKHPNSEVRRAAIVAYERLVDPKTALKDLGPFLTDKEDLIRLAAARALMSYQPRETLETLYQLHKSANGLARLQAKSLLDRSFKDSGLDKLQGDVWDKQVKQLIAKKPFPKLDWKARLDSTSSLRFVETFSTATDKIQGQYRSFHFEMHRTRGNAAIRDGMLRLDNFVNDGDVRLSLKAKDLFGMAKLPDRFTINGKMGGDSRNIGIWHVGISMGNIRVLFHPGYEGGAFRAQLRDDHARPLFHNMAMSWTPPTDTLHDIRISVLRKPTKTHFDVTIVNPTNQSKWSKSFTATNMQTGAWDQIGLVRSGRAGGTGLFGPLVVEFGR